MSENFDFAMDLLPLIGKKGLTITLEEPNEAMCQIGAETGKISMETARAIYEAMIEESRKADLKGFKAP